MIDGVLRRHWLKIAVIAGWVLALMAIPNFSVFSEWLFAVAVAFLMIFGRIGLDYTVVCLILPGLAFAGAYGISCSMFAID